MGKHVYLGKAIKAKSAKNPKVIGALAVVQFLDYLTGYTRDKNGKRIKFTERKWVGRLKILYRLAFRYGGIRHVRFISKLKQKLDAGKISKTKAKQEALKYARKHGLTKLINLKVLNRYYK